MIYQETTAPSHLSKTCPVFKWRSLVKGGVVSSGSDYLFNFVSWLPGTLSPKTIWTRSPRVDSLSLCTRYWPTLFGFNKKEQREPCQLNRSSLVFWPSLLRPPGWTFPTLLSCLGLRVMVSVLVNRSLCQLVWTDHDSLSPYYPFFFTLHELV